MNRIQRIVIGRLAMLRRHRRARQAKHMTESAVPELLRAYSAFEAAQQISSTRQPLKGWDLWCLLESFRPKFIGEMGSGTTSAVFALWAKRNSAQYTAYEHHSGWARVTEDALRKAELLTPGSSPIRVVACVNRTDRPATGFAEPIPQNVDFLYIDGPPCKLPDGRKVPNDDVVLLLESGARPRAIVIDGRHETVDLILTHELGRYYTCAPEYSYCIERGLWKDAASGCEHTLFTLRQ